MKKRISNQPSVFSRQKGNVGEDFVCSYLEKSGASILCRNFSAAGGEIDIIFEKGEYIVFTEVKLRNSCDLSSALESIDEKKVSRIKSAAEFFLEENKDTGCVSLLKCRFDVAVIYNDGTKNHLEYIENAFI